MSVTVELAPEMERKLAANAAALGYSPHEYLGHVAAIAAERCLLPPKGEFDRICAEIREEFDKAGMTTDEQIEAFFEPLIKKVRAERRQAAE